MATYTQILMSAAALAAVVPMAHSARGSWFSRIADRFRRSEPKQAVADPPSIPNDAGWQLIHSENADSFEAWLLKDQSGLPLGSSEQPSLGSHLLITQAVLQPAHSSEGEMGLREGSGWRTG